MRLELGLDRLENKEFFLYGEGDTIKELCLCLVYLGGKGLESRIRRRRRGR